MTRLKRGQSGLSGIVAIDKDAGMTSHDVVDRCRRIFNEKRVGHAGTLDPDATGLLLVGVGPATRLSKYLTAAEKSYEARILFGVETNTDDASGEVVRVAPVPDEAEDPFFAQGFVDSLRGSHEQIPPAFSAVKLGGKVSYKEARKGEPLELAAREIEIFDAVLLGITTEPQLEWDLLLTVSKGTYIRSLARDIGRALGGAAHLSYLRRVSSGNLTIANAITLGQLQEIISECEDISEVFIDPTDLLGMPRIEVGEEEAIQIVEGKALSLSPHEKPQVAEADLVALTIGEKLLSIHRVQGDVLVSETVFAGGVSGVRARA